MAKRQKRQGVNILVGAYKRIMLNGGAKGPFNHRQLAVMLQAADRYALIDGVFTSEQIAAMSHGEMPVVTDDAVLAELREKFRGGTPNADTPSNV
jgi:hypothetical protein